MAPILIASFESAAKRFPECAKQLEQLAALKPTLLSTIVSLRTEFTMECEKKDLGNTFCRVIDRDENMGNFMDVSNPQDYDFTRCHVVNVIPSRLKKKSKVDLHLLSNYAEYGADIENSTKTHSLGDILLPWIKLNAEPEEQEVVPQSILEAITALATKPHSRSLRTIFNQQIFNLVGKDVLENHTIQVVHNNEPYRMITWRHIVSELIGLAETKYAQCSALDGQIDCMAEVFIIPEYLFFDFCDMCYNRHCSEWAPINAYDLALALEADGEAKLMAQLDWQFAVPLKALPETLSAADVALLVMEHPRSVAVVLESGKRFEFVKRSAYVSKSETKIE